VGYDKDVVIYLFFVFVFELEGRHESASEAMAKERRKLIPLACSNQLSKTSRATERQYGYRDYPCEQQEASHSLIRRALLSFV